MRIDVAWMPAELAHMTVHDRVAVVVDVLRAASTIATAIHNGARAVLPARSTEEALRIANSIGRDGVVLCGERGGVRIDGFELGNSPAEFTAGAVAGRTLVMTTTNGTRALAEAAGARRVYVAALVNAGAVAEKLAEAEGDLLIVCAGRDGQVSVEDALCAGTLVGAVVARRGEDEIALGDGAIAARALAERPGQEDFAEFLRRTAAGNALRAIGHAADIEYCAARDTLSDVPVLREGQITGVESVVTLRPVGGETKGG